MRGKMKHVRKFKNRSKRNPKKHGDIWTMDHVYMRDWFNELGVGGFLDFLLSKIESSFTKKFF